MASIFDDRKGLAVCAIVVLALSWYYFIYRAFEPSLNFINAVTAFSATIIITLSFLLGPLAKFSGFFTKYLRHRKTFGLVGYGLAALHILLVMLIYVQEPGEGTLGAAISMAVAGAAFVIFTIMAFTSTAKWVQGLGYENWKNLQRTGYIALALVIVHVALIEQGVVLTRLTGQIAVGLVLLALALRAIAILIKAKTPEKITV